MKANGYKPLKDVIFCAQQENKDVIQEEKKPVEIVVDEGARKAHRKQLNARLANNKACDLVDQLTKNGRSARAALSKLDEIVAQLKQQNNLRSDEITLAAVDYARAELKERINEEEMQECRPIGAPRLKRR